MTNSPIGRPWPLARFSLRTFFIALTALCVWVSYEFSWIRRRHEFISQRDSISDAFNNATIDLDVSLPRTEIIPASSERAGLLWLVGESDIPSIDVYVVVDDDAIDLACPIESYLEARNAKRLFPEAQIIAGIVPKSMLERRPPAQPTGPQDGEPEIDP